MSYEKTKLMNLEDGQTLLGAIDGKMSDLKSAIQQTKADVITVNDTASSAIKTFPDGADDQPMAVQIAVEPVQDLHGYDNPWPGGGGKNLAKPYNYNASSANIEFTYYDDGRVVLNGSTSSSNITVPTVVQHPISSEFTLKAGTYIASIIGSSDAVVQVCDVANSSVLASSGGSFTIDSDKTVFVRVSALANKSFSNLTVYMQLESGSSATTFAPYSNICPVSGWTGCNVTDTGKNLLKNDLVSMTKNNVAFTKNADGTITVAGTANANTNVDILGSSSNPYKGFLAGTYIISKANTNNNIRLSINMYNGTTWVKQSVTGSTDNVVFGIDYDGYDGVVVALYVPNGANVNETVKPMIRYASVGDDTYEPFGAVSTIPFGQTVYGGELTINRDGTGSLVVDEGVVHLKDLTWEKRNYWCTNGTNFHTVGSDDLFVGWEDGGYETAISDVFKKSYERDPSALLTADNNSFWWNVDENRNFYSYYVIWGKAGSESTLSEFTTFLTQNDPVFCGKLYSPVTIPLTATQVKSLLGVNNIYADTGNILSVDYSADTKRYVDNLFASLTNATGVSF